MKSCLECSKPLFDQGEAEDRDMCADCCAAVDALEYTDDTDMSGASDEPGFANDR